MNVIDTKELKATIDANIRTRHRAEEAIRQWDGKDITNLQAAFLGAEGLISKDKMEDMIGEHWQMGRGWQGDIPDWDDLVAADVRGRALVWSDDSFVAVKWMPGEIIAA